MANTILVAGATGNLGRRIIGALIEQSAEVRALVREGTEREKVAELTQLGAEVISVDMSDSDALIRACRDISCVVSALQGLRDVIVDLQTLLLEAAVTAGVPRFIPSDYAIDYTKLVVGTNRNLDLRRAFQERIDSSAIAATSVLNGAFAELLTSAMPLIDFEAKQIRYWENAEQKLDFTTMDNTAAFTAAAALEESTPRFLRIAGDSISAQELAALIQQTRAASPESEKEEYPDWQGMQYMHNMFSGRASLEPLNNERYPHIHWTSVEEVIVAR